MPSKRQRPPKSKATRQATKPDNEALENEGSSLGSGLENVGFVVDLFLDQSGRVRLTQVLHVKSNEGEAWESWDERRLIEFFVQRAGMSLPEAELEHELPVSPTEMISAAPAEAISVASDKISPAEATAEVSETITAAPVKKIEVAAPPAKRAGRFVNGFGDREDSPAETPRVQAREIISHEVGIIPEHTQSQSRLLRRGESFDVQLFFGRENLFRAGNDELNYNASISAHTWGGLSTYFLAIGQGVIKSTDSAITVNIPKQNLEPGVYCVQAALTVTSREEKEQPAPVVSLTLKSGMLQVF